eukprot:TRINITY_DN1048_c0_g3_i3.p1 TRINITY_DN1048_c0_g3~~TRINITY_DN1048_c0_g3_i3.p1  ORF type:complete len:779 (+),score=244.65 TRINITY_DN1048_c0_g3_i3:73-2409(+)
MTRSHGVLLACALVASTVHGDRRPAGMLQMSDQLPGQWVVAFAATATDDDVARVIARGEALEPDNLEEGVVKTTRIGSTFTAVSLRFDETERAGFEAMPGVAMVEGDYLVHAEGNSSAVGAEADADGKVEPAPAGHVEGVDFVTVGDGAGRAGRGAHGLAAVEATSKMWPLGKVNFYITLTDVRTAQFVRDAIAHWEEHTCVRFTECASRDGCPKPYMNFVSVKGCSAYMGMNKYGGVDNIDITKLCMFGGAVHEIGHALGLNHEQTRNDRDEFVYINFGTIHSSVRQQFSKMGALGRDYGPYNYKSIMHYNAFSFTQRKTVPSIVSPYPVGQYNGLSEGDITVIQWMYNECRATYERPVPMASRDVTVMHLVPHTKLFLTEFNVKYATDVLVTYATDAPASTVEYSVPAGGTMRPIVNNTYVRFVPTAAEAGQEYTFTLTFTGKDNGASTSTTLRVKVADAEFVCDGLSASDPNVCHGRGTCDGGRRQPCTCRDGYGGHYCEGYKSCPNNYGWTFETGQDVWKLDGDTSEWSPRYGGSLQMGIDGSEGRGYGHFNLIKRSNPRAVRWSAAYKLPNTNPGIAIRGLGGTCASVVFRDGVLLFAGAPVENVPAEYMAEGRDTQYALAFDWRNKKATLSVEGEEVSTRQLGRCYGVDEVYMYGRVFLTSMYLDCFDRKVIPLTPRPPTPAPTPSPPRVTLQPTPAPTVPTPSPAMPGDCVDKTPNGVAWFSGYGASYGCAYFGDERFIDQVPNRCEKWGNDKRNMGWWPTRRAAHAAAGT